MCWRFCLWKNGTYLYLTVNREYIRILQLRSLSRKRLVFRRNDVPVQDHRTYGPNRKWTVQIELATQMLTTFFSGVISAAVGTAEVWCGPLFGEDRTSNDAWRTAFRRTVFANFISFERHFEDRRSLWPGVLCICLLVIYRSFAIPLGRGSFMANFESFCEFPFWRSISGWGDVTVQFWRFLCPVLTTPFPPLPFFAYSFLTMLVLSQNNALNQWGISFQFGKHFLGGTTDGRRISDQRTGCWADNLHPVLDLSKK